MSQRTTHLDTSDIVPVPPWSSGQQYKAEAHGNYWNSCVPQDIPSSWHCLDGQHRIQKGKEPELHCDMHGHVHRTCTRWHCLCRQSTCLEGSYSGDPGGQVWGAEQETSRHILLDKFGRSLSRFEGLKSHLGTSEWESVNGER